jgi:hypothetical protein
VRYPSVAPIFLTRKRYQKQYRFLKPKPFPQASKWRDTAPPAPQPPVRLVASVQPDLPANWRSHVEAEVRAVTDLDMQRGQESIPREALLAMFCFEPRHQLQCVEGLRAIWHRNPARRLRRRIQNSRRLCETGEAFSDTDSEAGDGGVPSMQPAAPRPASAQPRSAEDPTESLPAPRLTPQPVPTTPAQAQARATRPRIEVVPGNPTYFHIMTQMRRTCCPGCGVDRNHPMFSWGPPEASVSGIYNYSCIECYTTWCLLRYSVVPSGVLLFVELPFERLSPDEVSAQPLAPRGRQIRLPRCTSCGAMLADRDVIDLPGRMCVGLWECRNCGHQLFGSLAFDFPWARFCAYSIARRHLEERVDAIQQPGASSAPVAAAAARRLPPSVGAARRNS